ncbi:DUF1415 domain-containing protein [Catenovulum sp. SM1970]|uniref:DUF1415 domain-containing protein n=1 Tax=Marinifaba aquimaris TaxID=2741323 RepID=UPI00157394D1|nr:DUF1415 domain-containing protein [Marinifaba aquimaris]NTS75586.1 DUF1415 domain-containing protein [Marinifaba aquimaris]
MALITDTPIQQAVETWLVQVVIGLNLCPFAAKPHKNKQIRISISDAKYDGDLADDLKAELDKLCVTNADELDTTLLIVPNMLSDFHHYNDFLFEQADALLDEYDWSGTYQIASFHPEYCFEGLPANDEQNLTNRSPFPILHILREDSLSRGIDHFPDVDAIPENNIKRILSLSEQEKQKLFGYLSLENL